jgi:AcrR family transcriptional regulator
LQVLWERLPEPDGELLVHLLPGEDAPPIEVSCPDSPPGEQIEALADERQDGATDAVRVPVAPHHVRTLLTRRVVKISWGRDHHALFPINISQESKTGMPSILGAKPSEEQLLAYFHGRISEDDLLVRLLEQARNQTKSRPSSADENSQRRQMQNYIVREFVESLFGLVNTIRDSARSPRAAEQALMGDLSPDSLGEQVIHAFTAGRRSPTATAFQMVELIAAVGGFQWFEEHVKTVIARAPYEQLQQRALDRLFDRLSQAAAGREDLRAVLHDGEFQRYTQSTLPPALSGRWESLVKALGAEDKA